MDVPRVVVGPLGQKLLFYQGHVYTMKAKKNAINVRWICHHNKLYKCKATINTDNQTHPTINKITPHSHPPSDEEFEQFVKQMEVKKLAYHLLDGSIKPGDLINESLTYKSLHAKRGKVSLQSMKRQLRRDRDRLRKRILEQSQSMPSDFSVTPPHIDNSVNTPLMDDSVTPLFDSSVIPPYFESSVVPPHFDNPAIPPQIESSVTPAHFLDTPTRRCEEISHDFNVPEVPKQERTSEPSTSGKVPTASANTPDPPQPHNKPYIPIQADVNASTKRAASAVRPTPTPVGTNPDLSPSPPPPDTDPLEDDSSISVKWNTYANNMSSIMPSLLEDEKFVDVTLACDGKYIKCHKVILGACSPYFEELLSVNPCQHPIILMKDFQFWEIRAIVDFIYCGFVNIPQHKLPKLLKVANILQIKGLTGSHSYSESKENSVETANCSRDTEPQHSTTRQQGKVTEPQGSNTQSPARNLRKRPELPPTSLSKSSVPKKKKKSISSNTGRKTCEPHEPDENSLEAVFSQSTSPAEAASLEPPSPMHQVCIKEESNSDLDDPPDCSFRNDQNMDRNDQNMDKERFSQLGQFQLLTFPTSRNFKQETNEELMDSADQDPLDLESGVS